MLRILGNASSINVRKVLGACAEIPAMDINTRCRGFIAAVDTLSWPLIVGRYQRILLVCSDIASCGLEYEIRQHGLQPPALSFGHWQAPPPHAKRRRLKRLQLPEGLPCTY